MEERRGVKQSIVVACLVLGLLMGGHRSEAINFPSCYKNCFILCVITPGENAFKCGFKCLKDCIFHPPSLTSIHADTDYFCKLGCSMSRCSHLSTKTNARENEVSGCVDSCSGMCSKQH